MTGLTLSFPPSFCFLACIKSNINSQHGGQLVDLPKEWTQTILQFAFFFCVLVSIIWRATASGSQLEVLVHFSTPIFRTVSFDDRITKCFKTTFHSIDFVSSNRTHHSKEISYEPRRWQRATVYMPMKWKTICAYLKGLSKYSRMVFFFLKYLFSF